MTTTEIQPGIDSLYPVRKLLPYLAELERAWTTGNEPETNARELDDNWELIRELHSRAVEHANASDEPSQLCCDLVIAAPTLLQSRLTRQEMVEWIELALQAAEKRSDPRAIGTLLTFRGIAERDSHSLVAAAGSFQRALDCYRELHDESAAARCLANSSLVIAMRGDLQAARERLQVARSYFEEHEDHRGLMMCLGSLSIVEQRMRRYSPARDAADLYLELAQDLESRQDEILALGQLGTCCRRLGSEASDENQDQIACENWELAIAYYHRQKELAIELGDTSAQQRAIGNLGNAYSDLNRLDEAIACHRESLHLSTATGNLRGRAADHLNLGIVLMKQGELVEAEVLFQEALAYSRTSEEPAFQAAVLWNLMEIADRRNDISEAIKFGRSCLAIREAIHDPRLEETREAMADLQKKKGSKS